MKPVIATNIPDNCSVDMKYSLFYTAVLSMMNNDINMYCMLIIYWEQTAYTGPLISSTGLICESILAAYDKPIRFYFLSI